METAMASIMSSFFIYPASTLLALDDKAWHCAAMHEQMYIMLLLQLQLLIETVALLQDEADAAGTTTRKRITRTRRET